MFNAHQRAVIAAYEPAFGRCYPQRKLGFRPGRNGTIHVIIDEQEGDRPLTPEEMESAVRDFNRGKRGL